MAKSIAYNNNSNLKKCGIQLEYTEEQILEIKKCSEDPIYFVDNYCQIVTLDKGVQQFKLWDFQKDLINTYHNNRMVLTMLSRQSSKCVIFTTNLNIKNKITGETKEIFVGDFHKLISDSSLPINEANEKFVESFSVFDWMVESESGFVDIISSNKTIPYEVYSVVLDNGLTIECADNHILIDENNQEVFAKDSLNHHIKTKKGISKVVEVAGLNFYDSMYDLSISSEDHTYYTNDILSHNTTTTVAYILWYTLFQGDKNVAILANKDKTAREVLSRYEFMYEYLPIWMQQGVKVWNKGDVELENGSKVFTAATSSSGLRGKSCVTGDAKVCIEENDEIYYTEIQNILNNSNLVNKGVASMNNQYAIYQTTNLKNDKIYVGFHTIPESGIKEDYQGIGSIFKDGYLGSGKILKAAVAKYGPESFSQEILEVFDNKEEAEAYERYIVDEEFTLDDMTYNIAIGGNLCVLAGENRSYYTGHLPKVLCIETGVEYKGYKEVCDHFGFENSPEFTFSETPSKCIRMFIYRLCYEGKIKLLSMMDNDAAIARYTRYLDWVNTSDERKIAFAKMISERFSNRKQSKEHVEKRISGNKKWKDENPELHALRMEKINKNPEKIAKTAAKHRGMKRSPEACKNISESKIGAVSSTKGKRLATHIETGTIKYFDPEDEIPEGYTTEFSGYNVGKKSYTDGTQYKMFVEGTEPEGWWQQGPPKKKKS